MSDLSRLLDDVYGPSGAAAVPEAAAPGAAAGLPDRALDPALADTFTDWAPGGFSEPTPETGAGPAPSPQETGTELASATTPPAAIPWCRADDDILPTRRARGATRGRRAPVETLVTSIEAFAAEEALASKGRFRRRKG